MRHSKEKHEEWRRLPIFCRSVYLLAIVIFLLSLSACQKQTDGGDGETRAAESVLHNESEENQMNHPFFLITNGFDKLAENDILPAGASDTYTLSMAKNEAESCQIAIRSDVRMGSVSFACTESPDSGPTLALFREDTVPTGNNNTPDGLIPFSGKLTLPKEKTTVLLLRFTAQADTAAGDYTYRFALTDGDIVLGRYTVSVHVYDFALPDEPGCATAVGLYRDSIAAKHGSDAEQTEALYRAYYDLLLSYKVNAYDLPYDILDARADAYMSDVRVTSFRVPSCDEDDERLAQIYEKLSSNPVWLAKAYFYPLDEPTSKEMLDTLADLCARLQRLAPAIPVCTPFFLNIDYDKNTDQIAFMTGKTTLWCPKSYMYMTSNVYSEKQLETYPPFPARMAERQAAGDHVWWYVCWEPGNPYNNLFVDQKGVQHRILFWQQYAYDVEGFLYWGANYWTGVEEPWSDMATVKNLSPDVYGDGSLLYPGSTVGIDGACPSLRLEAIRDGVEDNALFKLAASLLGRAWVDEKIAQISSSLTQYTTDSARFLAVRNEICEAVEAALGRT